jgi:tetratricopeptide (TPR) repeat protein
MAGPGPPGVTGAGRESPAILPGTPRIDQGSPRAPAYPDPMRRLGFAALLLLSPFAAGGKAQETRGDLRRELGELWAEQRYDDLLRRVGPNLEARPEAADLWMMAAEAALKLEDHGRAIAWFEKSLALSPKLGGAAINLGFAYLKADRLDDAGKAFAPFLKDPSKGRAAKAHYGLGLVLSARGEEDKAREAWEHAAALNPDDVRPHYRLGQLALQSGDSARAQRLFAAVLEKDDLHHGAAYGLARALGASGPGEPGAAEAAERHRRILAVSDALPAMIRRLGEAQDPVAARIAISEKLLEAGARQSAMVWRRRAEELRGRERGAVSRPESRR